MRTIQYSSDKINDISDVIEKISLILSEYDLTLQEAISIMFSILEDGAEKEIKRGSQSKASVVKMFSLAHKIIIQQILGFEESLNE